MRRRLSFARNEAARIFQTAHTSGAHGPVEVVAIKQLYAKSLLSAGAWPVFLHTAKDRRLLPD